MVHENNHPDKRLKLFIGTLVLLLILISSSIFFFVRTQGSRERNSASSAVTATTTPKLTPTQTLTSQPLFAEYFIDNSKGWYLSDVADYTRTISDGKLMLAATNHKILVESLPSNTKFDNCILTVAFTLQQGDAQDSVGVYVRGDSNLDHDYRIDIYGDSTYAINKETLDAQNMPMETTLIPRTHSSLLAPVGRANVLRVIMKGPELVLMINDNVVNSITDLDYTRGQIALFVANGSTSEGVKASFGRVEVDSVPDVTPVP
ncbi:DUF1080 domain-containing protein [Ktedonosporobacter rubrisoli]|uniref:DUF1080 domain-containing protein n=1 Tax=Ktedonosporobacter rubrisoli TaxID=2509675 RepID=A0A4P6K4J2_KTERU|nr:family 16 glycoside hydrolase [Ktedonosporobacter rubrisoli]QBD83114.1 DUF1080 domain-containing protein [Ktedonosporobacter rubrisoli]